MLHIGCLVRSVLTETFESSISNAKYNSSNFWRSARAVIMKVAIDQLCYTPIAIGLFYGTLNTLEGRPQDLPATMQVGLKPYDKVRSLCQALMSSYNH